VSKRDEKTPVTSHNDFCSVLAKATPRGSVWIFGCWSRDRTEQFTAAAFLLWFQTELESASWFRLTRWRFSSSIGHGHSVLRESSGRDESSRQFQVPAAAIPCRVFRFRPQALEEEDEPQTVDPRSYNTSNDGSERILRSRRSSSA
jgi:hypothetical protein